MNLETDGADTPAPAADALAAAAPAPVETPSEATADQPAPAENGTEPDDAGADEGEPPKRVPWFQKRIDEVTRQKYDAQREAAYWRGLAEAGKPQPQQHSAPADQPPREDEFASYEEYERARIDYAVEQRLQTVRELDKREASARSFGERVEKVRDKLPDFDLYVGDPTLPITPLMAEVIRESDVGPEVAYHLGKNRSECQRIAALPQHRQAAELGRIEATLSISAQKPSPAPSPRPTPPAPPQTVAGIAAGVGKTPEEMSMAEYMDWVKSRDKA